MKEIVTNGDVERVTPAIKAHARFGDLIALIDAEYHGTGTDPEVQALADVIGGECDADGFTALGVALDAWEAGR